MPIFSQTITLNVADKESMIKISRLCSCIAQNSGLTKITIYRQRNGHSGITGVHRPVNNQPNKKNTDFESSQLPGSTSQESVLKASK